MRSHRSNRSNRTLRRLALLGATLALGVAPAARAQLSGGFPITPVLEVRGPFQHAVIGSSFVEPDGALRAETSATLDLPDGARSRYGLLVWQGSGDPDPTLTLALPGGAQHAVDVDAETHCKSVFLEDGNNAPTWWQCATDVSAVLDDLASLDGAYRVSGLTAETGSPFRAGNTASHTFAGGWTLVLLYVDPADLYPRSIQVATGLWGSQYASDEASTPLLPFQVGPNGGRLTLVAMEGDVEFPGPGECNPYASGGDPDCDFMFLCDGSCSVATNLTPPLANVANPAGNLFNETVSSFEASVVSGVSLTNGLDIDTFDLGAVGLPVAQEIPDLRVGVQTGGDLVFQTVLVVEVTDYDADGDGLSNIEEEDVTFTDPDNPDTDGDGIPDGVEYNGGNPTDPHSNPTDPLNPDSDGDGLCDGSLSTTFNGVSCAGGEDVNDNGLLDDGETDPNNADTDGDGLSDGTEVLDGDYGDGQTDPLDPDTDDDGLSDGAEDSNGNGHWDPDNGETDPTLWDTDGGGESDGSERTNGRDPVDFPEDDNGLLDDDDGDGIDNGTETTIGTDPDNPDSDGDGIPDGVEANPTTPTDPLDPDSDDDGIPDGEEDTNHDGVVDPGETSPLDPDSDGDGLSDGTEAGGDYENGPTDPLTPDTDGDGLLDGEEDRNGNGVVDPGETDPTVPDLPEPPGDGGPDPDAGPVNPGDGGTGTPVVPEPGFIAGSAVHACGSVNGTGGLPFAALLLLLALRRRRR